MCVQCDEDIESIVGMTGLPYSAVKTMYAAQAKLFRERPVDSRPDFPEGDRSIIIHLTDDPSPQVTNIRISSRGLSRDETLQVLEIAVAARQSAGAGAVMEDGSIIFPRD